MLPHAERASPAHTPLTARAATMRRVRRAAHAASPAARSRDSGNVATTESSDADHGLCERVICLDRRFWLLALLHLGFGHTRDVRRVRERPSPNVWPSMPQANST